MPPQKRALSERELNEQSKSQKVAEGETAGKGKTTEAANGETNDSPKEWEPSPEEQEEMDRQKSLKPYEYYCINRPYYDVEAENCQKEKGERLGEDALDEYYEELSKKEPLLKPIAEHPEHKWILMWKSYEMVSDCQRLAGYTNPDNFRMYIYNDFNGYGIQELIENQLIAFNKEISKKNKDLDAMWALVAGLGYWLNVEQLMAWMMLDDGERWGNTTYLIGIAFLEALNQLDQAKKLAPKSPESTYKDLGLIMSLYLKLGLDEFSDADDTTWVKSVIGYAKKAGIDLVEEGCFGTQKRFESCEKKYRKIEALKDAKKGETNIRWKWRAKYREHEGQYYPMGGERFNILKMSREKRAEHSFKGKDPLADVSDKDLREGKIVMR